MPHSQQSLQKNNITDFEANIIQNIIQKRKAAIK